MPEPEAEFLRNLGAKERKLRRLACDDAIAALRERPELRDPLHRVLANGTPEARFSAVWILFRSGNSSLRLLPALLDSLELPDGDLRWSAVHMLATLGRIHPEVLHLLLHEAREARQPTRRRMSLFALRELAPEQDATHAVLLSALDDSDSAVQRAALSCFAKLCETPRTTADRILQILESHPDPRMRRIAAAVTPEVVAAHPELLEDARRLLGALRASSDPALARAARAALPRLPEHPGSAS